MDGTVSLHVFEAIARPSTFKLQEQYDNCELLHLELLPLPLAIKQPRVISVYLA